MSRITFIRRLEALECGQQLLPEQLITADPDEAAAYEDRFAKAKIQPFVLVVPNPGPEVEP